MFNAWAANSTPGAPASWSTRRPKSSSATSRTVYFKRYYKDGTKQARVRLNVNDFVGVPRRAQRRGSRGLTLLTSCLVNGVPRGFARVCPYAYARLRAPVRAHHRQV